MVQVNKPFLPPLKDYLNFLEIIWENDQVTNEGPQWIKIFHQVGFTIEGKHGISMLHNFLRILTVRENITAESLQQNEEAIWEILNYFHDNGKLSKHMIWSLVKSNEKKN